jgi:hypothetical protein
MKRFLFTVAAVGLFLAGAAVAQTISVPQVVNVGPSDLFNDVVGGQPRAGNQYATAAQIAGVPGYHSFGTISADPAYTVPNGVTDLFGHGASTITAVTITTEPNPADGKRECYWADQTTTTLTWTANTGQTINANVPAAGVAKTSSCITYQASSATWFASP